MQTTNFIKSLSLFIFLYPLLLISQSEEKESIKLFVECNCVKNYIRQEIKHIDHVRDQGLANVQLFIYDITNGSGGRTYKLEFTGSSSFKEITNTLSFDSNPNMTSDEIRKQTVLAINKGLIKYIIESDLADKIIDNINGEDKNQEQEIEDPWKNWIFEISGSASYSKEASRKRFDYEVGFESDRVTEKWRIRTDLEMNQTESKFIQNDEEFTSSRQRYWGGRLVL